MTSISMALALKPFIYRLVIYLTARLHYKVVRGQSVDSHIPDCVL